MRINTFLIIILISLNAISQDNTSWIKEIKSSNKVNVNTVDSLYKLSDGRMFKHYERWKWINRLDVDDKGFLKSKNEIVNQYKETYANNKSLNYGNWSPLGPTDWVNGNSGYNPGNGRINAVTVDPNNSNIIYVCAASGGLWKSNNAGQTWNCITDGFPIQGTSDIEINPNNPEIIYLATGDRDGYNSLGLGVYKSIDGGASWDTTGLNDEIVVNCLEINYNNPEIIFAGTKSGLYKTENAGTTWEKVIPFGDIKEIKLNPLNPNTVFAVREDRFYRSFDGGNNFETIWDFPTLNLGRIAFDVTIADTSYIYALIADFNENFMGVYRSTNGGTSFTEMVNGDEINLLGYDEDGDDNASQAFYDLAIAVSADNKDVIYTGGVNVWRSIDGGNNWSIISKWYHTGDNSVYSHADIHSLDVYGNTLYCGSDGGVFKNTNYQGWEDISSGLNISEIYKMSNSHNGSMVSIGCQDNGTNLYNSNWKHIRGADGMETIIDYSNPNNVYCSVYYATIYKSTTGGDNNNQIFSADNYGEGANWVAPYIIDKIYNNILYIGAENIYKTTNFGSSWTAITNLNSDNYFDYIAIAPSNSNYIYAARSDMFIRTKNGGDTWAEITLPSGGTVTGIEISNSNPEKIFVSTSNSTAGNIMVSEDAGDNFETPYSTIYSGIYSIAYENNEENGIYAATSLGVLYINDDLADWVNYSINLPFVKVTELELVTNINKLRASTYGRGVWESDLYAETVSIDKTNSISTFNIYPNPVENTLNIKFNDLNISKLYIYNVSGFTVFYSDNINKNISVDVSNYIEGSYFVKIITTDNKEIVQKFVKK